MALTDILGAVAVGVAFGFALERGGLGSARKLTGQFFLTDLTVFKVMFSAIVTAMLGTFWLGRLGVMDVAFLYVPDTYLPAQVVGGAIFGAGFALAGLCPGTSCVATASGRGDGAMVVAGMFAGVVATGLGFPLIERLYVSGARGAWTLPQLLHLPYGVVVFLVVLVALAGFAAAERIEARPRNTTEISPRITRSTRIFWLAIAMLALGAAAAGRPTPKKVEAASAPAAPAPVRPGNGC
jgi:uncharacterized membrane protein YedE/YeeE